jgi:hypothetical protein
MRRVVFACLGLLAITGCDQMRIRNTSTHNEPPEASSAFIVGSSDEKSSTDYVKAFPVQIDWDTIRDSPFTFNPFDVKRGLRVGVRLLPGTRNIQTEIRLRRDASAGESYAGGTVTFSPALGKTYVVRAKDMGERAHVWIADSQTDEIVSDVISPQLGKPPPGFPRTPIIIFIRR